MGLQYDPNPAKRTSLAALVMAAYAAGTILLGPIGYGPVQVRLTAGLYVLCRRWPYLSLPLGLAAALANYMGGYGASDIVCGAVVTYLTCWACSRAASTWLRLALIPLVSAPLLAAYLHILFRLPYLLTAIYIAAGQTVAALTVGLALDRLVVRKC